MVPHVAEDPVQMGFSEGAGDGGWVILMIRVGPNIIARVPACGRRVGWRGCEDRGRGQNLRWVGVLFTLKMEEETSSLEKPEKAKKTGSPHPELPEGSSSADTLILAT